MVGGTCAVSQQREPGGGADWPCATPPSPTWIVVLDEDHARVLESTVGKHSGRDEHQLVQRVSTSHGIRK